ncbi:MAG: ABC transporter ATP-binding protein [Actinobacteria bacterium]|nr:MAG: ABC transporter ATP-binding protein [Actinomycetota bacterium]
MNEKMASEPMASENALSLSRVKLRTGRDKTLFDVDELDVRRGEVLCLIGPNGAGKSSLLKVLALLERPSDGRLLFDSAPAWENGMVAKRRRIAIVFQDPLLYDTTVFENVAAGLKFRRVPRREIAGKVRMALEMLGVAHLEKQRARYLSGGEAQRVSLARALVLEPEVFLLDEPFAGLDPEATRRLLSDLRALLSKRKLTTVFVTHDRSEAVAIADRVAVMMEGRIRQVGPVQEVLARPTTPEIAAFVGVENVLPGKVVSKEERAVEVAGGKTVFASERPNASDVFVSIRPEDILVDEPGEKRKSSARNRFEGNVSSISPAGPHFRIEVDCGFPLVSFLTKRAVEDLDLAPGSRVQVLFKATAVHLIDR